MGFERPGKVSQRSSDIGSTVRNGSLMLSELLKSVYQTTCR